MSTPATRAIRGDGQQLAAIDVGSLSEGVGEQVLGLVWQGHVDEDGAALGLDHVDGGAAARCDRRARA